MPTRPAAEARSHLLPAPPPLAAAARPAPRHSLQGCRAARLRLESPHPLPRQPRADPAPVFEGYRPGISCGSRSPPARLPSGRQSPTTALWGHRRARGHCPVRLPCPRSVPILARTFEGADLMLDGSRGVHVPAGAEGGVAAAKQSPAPHRTAPARAAAWRRSREAGLAGRGGASTDRSAGPGRPGACSGRAPPPPFQPLTPGRLTPLTPAGLPGHQPASRRPPQPTVPGPPPLATRRVHSWLLVHVAFLALKSWSLSPCRRYPPVCAPWRPPEPAP